MDSLQQDALQYYSSTLGQSARSFSPPNSNGFPTLSPPSSFKEDRSANVAKHTKKSSSIFDHFSDSADPSIGTSSSLSKHDLDLVIPGFSASFSDSPFGPLDQAASRKAFAHLISILNYSHPDHDFSSLQPTDFRRENSPTTVINSFNNLLFASGVPVPPTMWDCLDGHINLKDCAVYSHSPPESFLDDEPGTLWCYMWFFFNRRRKRVAYLHLTAIRTHHHSPVLTQDRLADKNRGFGRGQGELVDEYYGREEEYDLTLSSTESDGGVIGDLELD